MPILHWLNKDQAVTTAKHCDYRLLEAVPELSYGDAESENLLIQGDNLEALKALIPFYAGKVKCIFIDPPYNTKSAFEHYDDNLEHSKWLSLMYPRLELLRELLSEDGSIWVTIDDNEAHYLKVVMDEIFGRANFISNVVWQKRTSPDARATLGSAQDNIAVFSKSREKFKSEINKIPLTASQKYNYKNPDNDGRGSWVSTDLTGQVGHATEKQFYTMVSPNGINHPVPEGRCWALAEQTFQELVVENRIWFGADGKSRPRLKRYLSESKGVNPWTWWTNDEVGHNQEAKKEINTLFGASNAFDTPKPERLLQRILHIATHEGDLILDSFLGSGTTTAVAHKMNRRYIGIEIGEHAQTHCQPRLQKVVDGEQGGISKAVGWKGGGGFKFVRLGHTVFDEYGCLNKDIKFPTLAAHVWYLETKQPMAKKKRSALLGVHSETAYYLLYNGILGDRRPDGGNVLTSKVIKELPSFNEHLKHNRTIVIYGESTRLGEARLRTDHIVFKQIPYDVGAL